MCFIRKKKKEMTEEIQNKQAKEERVLRGYYVYIKVKLIANHLAVFNTKEQKINRGSEGARRFSRLCMYPSTATSVTWLYACKEGRLALRPALRRTKRTLEVVYKGQNPFALSLFVLFALPISDALDVLCGGTTIRRLDEL